MYTIQLSHHLKSQWPWLWPFRVTQGQMSRCYWTGDIWLHYKRLWNLSDLEFDHSSSLKVKSNGAVGLPIYEFLLMSNSMSISHRLGDICTWTFSLYLLSLGQNLAALGPPLPRADFFFSKSNHFIPGCQPNWFSFIPCLTTKFHFMIHVSLEAKDQESNRMWPYPTEVCRSVASF